MSCPKISALLSQHWRHSAQCDCLGSCWRAVSLNEDCKHAGKGFRQGPGALKGQAYTSVSTDSWFQPQWERSWQETVCCLWLWCCGCYTSWHLLAACCKTTLQIAVKVLDVLCEGDSTRPVGCCGYPLAGAGHSPTKWSIWALQSQKETHTYTQGGLTCCLSSSGTKCSSLGRRGNRALKGFPWELFTLLPARQCSLEPVPNLKPAKEAVLS